MTWKECQKCRTDLDLANYCQDIYILKPLTLLRTRATFDRLDVRLSAYYAYEWNVGKN